jgi:hypothetical protein
VSLSNCKSYDVAPLTDVQLNGVATPAYTIALFAGVSNDGAEEGWHATSEVKPKKTNANTAATVARRICNLQAKRRNRSRQSIFILNGKHSITKQKRPATRMIRSLG